jgi:hypothetical protein
VLILKNKLYWALFWVILLKKAYLTCQFNYGKAKVILILTKRKPGFILGDFSKKQNHFTILIMVRQKLCVNFDKKECWATFWTIF